jgi:nicotinamidase-related amidase
LKSIQPIYANAANSIVVVVDVQNRNASPQGESYDEAKARVVPAAVAVMQDLLGRARAAGVPIIYIQSVRTLQEPEFTVFGGPPSKRIGSWDAEIIDAIKPHPDDVVVQKFSHDAFYKTDLDHVLERLVPDPTKCFALVLGGATNLCVYHAVMGFYLRNYWTTVVTDGVFCKSDAARDRAYEQFSDRTYRSIFLTRSDLVNFAAVGAEGGPAPTPGA